MLGCLLRERRCTDFYVGLVTGVLTLLLRCFIAWPEVFPSLPARLTVHLEFPVGIAGDCEPLVATGTHGDGDILAVKYIDAENAVLIYDAWGVGGPLSAAFALEAGKRRTFELEMPALEVIHGAKPRDKRPLHAVLDGQELLRADVAYHRRQPSRIAFATNPIGGTISGPVFRGKITLPDGRALRGPESLFSWSQRLPKLITGRTAHFALDLLISAAAGLLVAGLVRLRLPRCSPPVFPSHLVAPHRWFAVAALACTGVFSTVITGGTFRFLYPDELAGFYDHQAASLLKGRLDVPAEALGGEAFVFEGRVYGYFGPTPALLRLPFTITRRAFGELSRCYMVGYFVACLLGAYALLIHAHRHAAGSKAWPSRFNTIALTMIAGLGTTLFFMSSRVYVYHEAILCGAAFAIWSSVFSLRWLESPHHNASWIFALICGVASVHARPPLGLFALSMLGCTALAHTYRGCPGHRSALAGRLRSTLRPLSIALLAGLGVLTFNAVSYLKFKSYDGAPLRYHVQYHPKRLAHIQGRNFHAINIPFNFGSYFWRPNFELRPAFPYFFTVGPAHNINPEAIIDLAEPVTAMPYSMPAAFFLGTLGCLLSLRRWPASRWPLGIVAGALAPMTAALLTAVAVSQRYTGDFVPALLIGSAFGLVALELLAPRTFLAARILIVILIVSSVFITTAITLHYQGEGVWGVPDDIKHRYESIRATFDGFFGSPARVR